MGAASALDRHVPAPPQSPEQIKAEQHGRKCWTDTDRYAPWELRRCRQDPDYFEKRMGATSALGEHAPSAPEAPYELRSKSCEQQEIEAYFGMEAKSDDEFTACVKAGGVLNWRTQELDGERRCVRCGRTWRGSAGR